MIKSFYRVFLSLFLVLTLLHTPVYADHAGHKFVRGIGNILTGWLEIPMNIYNASVSESPMVGMTYGLAKGIGMTIARTCIGAYEALTFPFPVPEEYKPLMEPEFVFQQDI